MDRPTLAEVLQQAMDARAAQIRTAIPAEVYSYAHLTQIADVRPTVWTDGEAPPIIPSVPVYWPRGDTHYLHMPLRVHTDKIKGDMGYLIASEADMGEWRRTGEEGPPADAARHHLQSAVFFPGIPSYDRALYPPPDNTSLILSGGPVRLGDPSATEPVMCGNQLQAAISAWAGAVSAAITLLGGDVTVALADLALAMAAAESPTVFVED